MFRLFSKHKGKNINNELQFIYHHNNQDLFTFTIQINTIVFQIPISTRYPTRHNFCLFILVHLLLNEVYLLLMASRHFFAGVVCLFLFIASITLEKWAVFFFADPLSAEFCVRTRIVDVGVETDGASSKSNSTFLVLLQLQLIETNFIISDWVALMINVLCLLTYRH